MYKKYGPLYGAIEGSNYVLSVADPDLLRKIFVKDFPSFSEHRLFSGEEIIAKNLFNIGGQQWQRVRTILSPTFSSRKLRDMTKLIAECCSQSLLDNLARRDTKKAINMKAYFATFGLDVIITCAFGVKVNSVKDPHNPITRNGVELFGQNNLLGAWLTYLFPGLARKFAVGSLPFDNMLFFYKLTESLIGERKQKRNGAERIDFLQIILDAENNKAESDFIDSGEKIKDLSYYDKRFIGKSLERDEIAPQAVLFLLAGYETTSTLLSHAAYYLAFSPAAQQRLYEEVSRCSRFDYDAINELGYLDAIIWETLRLSPPVIRVERVASEDYVLHDDKRGIRIRVPKGAHITAPIYAIQRDEKFFPDANMFKPERFLGDDDKKGYQSFTLLPFGGGPRLCIGMRFALIEAKLALANIVLKYKFIPTAETKVRTVVFQIPSSIKLTFYVFSSSTLTDPPYSACPKIY